MVINKIAEVVAYTHFDQLTLSRNGKSYTYFGVRSHDHKKIEQLIKKGHVGNLFKYLKQFSRPDMFEKGE